MTREYEERFLAARRAVIAAQFSNLNEQQRRAVMSTDGPLLLLAGAGSGKTTVLIHRIANLIRFGNGSDSTEVPDYITQSDTEFLEGYAAHPDETQRSRAFSLCALHPAAPWSIIAITFTNKAAGELRERLEDILGPDANDVWAMTFHAACCRILRREIERLGYDKQFTIYDTADSERVMRDVLRSMNLDEKQFLPRMILAQISRAKDKMQTPVQFAQAADAAGDYRMEKIAQAYAEYQKQLKQANAVDFDDIILLTVQLLLTYEDVRDYYQRKFRFVLIDEYQDTNHLQYLLASLLAGRHENICVVGDDDQSIYRFRGATIENILSFEQTYHQAQVIRLEQNYRSTQSILNAANAVIANNQGRKGKTLWTDNESGEPITVYEAFNEGDEANFVAGRIFSAGAGKNFKDFAILYRTNAQSNALEYAFKRNGVPYRIIGGTRFFDRAEVKDMLAYLCVINNRSDDLRLNRIINVPARGIGPKTVETANRLAQGLGKPLYAVLREADQYPALERAGKKIAQFTKLIEECAALLETLTLPEFYEELMIRTGYAAMLEQKNDVESRTRLENIRELKSSIINYQENTPAPTLNGFLEEISLYTDIEQYDREADAVVMMTMHSAKGLEFPHVFLVGLEEGLFPSGRAIGEAEEMEEERRLCYVAMTRAKQTLTISYADQRMLYGRTMVSRASRFIGEIPPKLLSNQASFQSRRGGAWQSAPDAYASGTSMQQTAHHTAHPALAGVKPKAPVPEYHCGDMVEHTAFGKGMVLSVLHVGNDSMLEIAFDNVGTKKLMANYAASHMKKL